MTKGPIIVAPDVTLYEGDNIEVMRQYVADESIDLTVTSPPYDNLRKYNGFTWDFEGVANELWRVTKPGGVVVWVVGDATVKGSETGTSFRQALYFKEIGFSLHDTMIYLKDNRRPRQSNRYEQIFEYMFVLAKGAPKVSNLRQIPCTQAGVVKKSTSRDHDSDILRSFTHTIKATKNDGNVWFYHTGMGQTTKDKEAFRQPAIFPEDLARDHILSWSNPGDVVFDPFLGSGTTGKMAVVTGRKFVGCDISGEYVELARNRISRYVA